MTDSRSIEAINDPAHPDFDAHVNANSNVNSNAVPTQLPNHLSPLREQIILACIDGSNVTRSVCDYAAWYANKLDLPVCLLHTIMVPKSTRHDLSGAIGMDSRQALLSELTVLDEQTAKLAVKHGEALVQDAKAHINKSYSHVTVKTHLRHGKLLPTIQHFSANSEVIILGRRGQDHQNDHVNIGSQIESVARAMHQPILICSTSFVPPDSYMLAFDGSPTAKKAVQMICDSDLSRGSTGYLVMVGPADGEQELSLYRAQKQMANAGLAVSVHVFSSKQHSQDVVKTLTDFQADKKISIIIMGAYGHAKWRRLIVGSTTTKLLTQTQVPVLLLR